MQVISTILPRNLLLFVTFFFFLPSVFFPVPPDPAYPPPQDPYPPQPVPQPNYQGYPAPTYPAQQQQQQSNVVVVQQQAPTVITRVSKRERERERERERVACQVVPESEDSFLETDFLLVYLTGKSERGSSLVDQKEAPYLTTQCPVLSHVNRSG